MQSIFIRSACSAVMCGTLAFSIAALGQQTGTANRKTATASDHRFATEAAQGGMAEVELGRLAQQKASSEDVKRFAQRMVDDHSKANDQLKQAAQQSGITLPADSASKHKASMARLQKLSGEAFDRAYMQNMVQDHKKDLAEFQKEANQGSDPNIKQFAQNTLPTLQEHLKLAEDVSGKAKGANSADRSK
jgi:putative membrane protein